MSYYLNYIYNNQAHKIQGGYYLNHDSMLVVHKEARKRLAFYFIAEQTPEKLDREDIQKYTELKKSIHRKFALLDVVVLLTLLKKTIFYRPKLTAPSRGLGMLGFAGRLMAYMALSSAYFGVVSHRKQAAKLNSPLVKEMSKKYDFSVYDFALARKEATLYRVVDMLKW